MERTKVLVVEANTAMREQLAKNLAQKEDIEIVGAVDNGHAALERMRDMRADVILTNIIMPTMDGFEMMEKIAELPAEQRPRVIVISAFCGLPSPPVSAIGMSKICMPPMREVTMT